MKKIALFLLVVLFCSCNKETTFSKTYKDFEKNRWDKTDVKTFDFTIDETIPSASVELYVSHISRFPNIPVTVTIEGQSHKKETIPVVLKFNDDKGNSLSDCAGDVCDFTQIIKQNIALDKGNYKITVQNNFDHAFLPNVLALGLTVRQLK